MWPLPAFAEEHISQHPRGGSQPPVTTVPADPISYSGFDRYQPCTWCTCVHRQNIHTHKTFFSEIFSVKGLQTEQGQQQWT